MAKTKTFPVEPFREWLINLYPTLTITELQHYVGMDERTLRAIFTGERKRVTLRVVDTITTHVGMPHVLNELYPLEEAEYESSNC